MHGSYYFNNDTIKILSNCRVNIVYNGTDYNEIWENPKCISFVTIYPKTTLADTTIMDENNNDTETEYETKPFVEVETEIIRETQAETLPEFSEIQESSYEMEETTEFEHDKINDDVNDLVFGVF